MRDFAIAVLHERHGTYLGECLDRLNVAMKSAGETIVATDESDPRAAEEIRAARSKYDFRVVHAPGDFAARKNAAVRETGGKYLAVVSVVDMPEEGCLEALIEFLESQPKAAAAGALLLRENGCPRPFALRIPSIRRSLACALRLVAMFDIRGYYFGRRGHEYRNPAKVSALPASCLVYRREALEQAGGFEEGRRFRFDDIEWSLSARKPGWRLFMVPAARAYHVAPEKSGMVEKDARLTYERSLLRFLRQRRGRIYEAVFRLTRMPGVLGGAAVAVALLAFTSFKSRQARAQLSTAAGLLGLLLFNRYRAGDAPGAEFTSRWQTAPWSVT